MSHPTKRPRTVATDTGAKVNRRADHHNRTRTSPRFRDAFAMTVDQVESAIGSADAVQLARALDDYGFVVKATDVTFRCPRCDRKDARPASRWIWRCSECDAAGSWLALRYLVAADLESCLRLAEIIHGVEIGRPVRDAS